MSLFGSTPSTVAGVAPKFNSSFGASTPGQPLFGSTTSSGGGLFSSISTSTPSTGLFGAKPGGTLFSTPAPAPASTGLFAAPIASSAAGGLFGAPASTSALPSFNLGGTPNASSALTFAATKPLPLTTNNMPQGAYSSDVAIIRAVTNPQLFGDERDALVAGLNQLLALTGFGAKAYIQAGQPPVQMKLENPYCRFKAVGYSKIADNDDSAGLVSIIIGKKAEEVRSQEQSVKDTLYRILGNRPALNVIIEAIKPLINDRCEIVFYVIERMENSSPRRITSSELTAFLSQPTVTPLLQQQLAAEGVSSRSGVDRNRLKQYLDAPSSGIDPVIWAQAKANNPNPDNLIPTPIFGFDQLAERQKMQTQEGYLQMKCLDELNNRILELGCEGTVLQSRARQLRSTQQSMSHRLLKLVCIENLRVRQGYAVDAHEEDMQSRLESLNIIINAPMQIKGRVGELVSLVRSRPEVLVQKTSREEDLDQDFIDQANVFLARCQHSIEELAQIVNKDNQTLQTIRKCCDKTSTQLNLTNTSKISY